MLFRNQKNRKVKANLNSQRRFETLERRTVFDVSLTPLGYVDIQGSDDVNDVAVVNEVLFNTMLAVNLNGSWQLFSKTDAPNGIRFYGYGGYDQFRNNSSVNSRAYGGDGGDILEGGHGVDTFYGQDGIDYLYGRGAADRLYGGTGNDRLIGGEGNDILSGNGGEDDLYGEQLPANSKNRVAIIGTRRATSERYVR